MHSYRGLPVTEAALKLAPLVFVRPGELRKAEWTGFDLDGAEWRIPAQRMKMRQPHARPVARCQCGCDIGGLRIRGPDRCRFRFYRFGSWLRALTTQLEPIHILFGV